MTLTLSEQTRCLVGRLGLSTCGASSDDKIDNLGVNMSNANYEVHKTLAPAGLIIAASSALPQGRRPVGLPANGDRRPIGRVGIVGSDATAVAVAMRLLDADVPVTLYDSRRESTAQAVGLARCAYETLTDSGRLAAGKRDRRMALLTGAANFHHLKDCDLVLATDPAPMADAEKLFHRLDILLKQGAILAADRTPDEIDRLARCTRRREVVGLRCSNLDGASGSVELVRSKETSEAAFATVGALLKDVGYEPASHA